MMNKRAELMDEEMELVNGGFSFNDIIDTVRKKAGELVDSAKQKIDEVVRKLAPGVKAVRMI